MDLDLRKVRYFVAVAEHLSFGRAAQALHIAQPVLFRQIRSLEHELKVSLFERDRRATRLTPAGEALLDEARALLSAAEAVRRRVHDTAVGQSTFTVGFMPGLIVTTAVSELSRRHPSLTVEVFRADWTNQTDVIRDGTVDIGYVRLPVDQRGLEIEPLFSEPRVAVVPASHRLADKDAVAVVDLAGERLLQDPDAVPFVHRDAAGPGHRTVPGQGETGSLTPGKQADIAIIDMRSPHLDGFGDPVAVMVLGAGPADVETVIVGGDILKRDGKLTGDRARHALELMHATRQRLSS